MKLFELPIRLRRKAKRVGRGHGSGKGKTSARGVKGQKSRSGYNLPRRFEGGQASFIQRLPKVGGFTSPHPKPPTIRIDRLLQKTDTKRITPKLLIELGLLSRAEWKHAGRIKIVGTSDQLRPMTWSTSIRLSKQLEEKIKTLKSLDSTKDAEARS